MTITSDESLIKASEGLRLQCYDDATGEPLEAGQYPKGRCTIGYGHATPDVYPGQTCTTAEADAWFQWDLPRARRRAAADLGGDAWGVLDEVRRAALTDMAFCMGGRGLAGFTHMLHAVVSGDWTAAYGECLMSRWGEREAPGRAKRDAEMLLTGAWPA